MKLLIAEDTTDLNRVIKAMLEHAGYSVDAVFDGEAALEQIDREGYDALILDIMMPKRDGISVLQNLRSRNINIPVLLLTAKAEVDDRVAGLDAGADDYLPKPFAMKELLARVNAMTRRRTKYAVETLTCSNFTLDSKTLELSAKSAVRLSMKEYELLMLLMQRRGIETDTETILDLVWSREPDADADTVFLYISYLRRKLSSISAEAEIEGERGKAFVLKEKG